MYHAEDVANRVHNRPQARAAAGGRRPGRWLLILLAFALIFGASERAPAATTYTLRPVADTVAKQAFPNNNYGTVATLPIRYGATGRAEYVFLRFSVPALAGSVTSATLSARVTGTVREVSSYATSMGNPTWAENWLTWNNWSAGTSFTFLGSRANLNPGTNHTVDVTGWLTPPNTTFGLVSAIDAAGQSFSSREGSVAPTLTIVTSGNLGKCSSPQKLLIELNSLVTTGNLVYACDYKKSLSPTFNAWSGGSENLPVIAAAIALFDGPVVNGTDYRTWWQTFFNRQASTTGSGHLRYFKGSELFSNVYDASTVGGILLARYWANLNGHTQIRNLAGDYLRRNWFAWALGTSPQAFDSIHRNQGNVRTQVDGGNGSCPTLALASPRSVMGYTGDSKRWLLAKFLGYNQTCYKIRALKDVVTYAAARYSALSGLSGVDRTALRALINNTTIPSNLASVLGAVRMERDFHFLLWSDGRRATYYLGHQLNNNISFKGGKHTVFTALFNRSTRDLDLLFAEGRNNESCAVNSTNRIVVDDLGASGCSSTNWFPMPVARPTHHFVLGPSGWRTCSTLSC